MRFTFSLLLALLLLPMSVSAHQSIVEYPIPSGSTPGNVCAGPNGQERFVGNAKIGYVDSLNNYQITEYAVPGSTSGFGDSSFSPASLLWFGIQNPNTLYSFD